MQQIAVRNLKSDAWYRTPGGEPRGFITPHALDELWFHTGTACNLACPFCLEGSRPGDTRLQVPRYEDLKPYIDEALSLGVRQFAFTGGEPFLARDLPRILSYALEHRPCLVLTNGTDPLLRRLWQLEGLRGKPQALHFRISLDHPEEARHDAGRGAGSFAKAMESLRRLSELGFPISVASQKPDAGDAEVFGAAFRRLFAAHGLPSDLLRIEFPDFHAPGSLVGVPQISAQCITRYHSEDSRKGFMCAFSKMVVKKQGRMRVYACTLVDDDGEYDLGASLAESMSTPISMKHHRCYSCFAYGASCSELSKHGE